MNQVKAKAEKQKKRMQRIKKRQISLKRKFTGNMFFIFGTAFLLFSILIGVQVFKGIEEEKRQQNEMYIQMLSNQVVESIEKYKSVVETVALQQEVMTLDYTQIEPYFEKFLTEENRKIWSHFIICNQYGTEQAHSEGYSGHGFSISRNPCFKVPFQTGETYVGSPEISISTGRAVMGIGVPIVRNEKTVGVILGYVWLEHISDMLNSYPLTDNSFVFMLDESGVLCAHPDTTRVFQENWITDENVTEDIRLLSGKMAKGESGSMNFSADGKKNSYTYQRIGNTKLSICVVSPYQETYNIALATVRLLVVITVIFMVICILCTAFMVSNMLHPMKWMEEQMYRFSAGIISVMDKKLKFKNTREMTAFYQSVVNLSQALGHMINRLEEESVILSKSADMVRAKMEDADAHVTEIMNATEHFKTAIADMSENINTMTKSSQSILNFAGSISSYALEGKEYVDEINDESRKMKKTVDVNRSYSEDTIQRITRELSVLIEDSREAAEIERLTGQIRSIAGTTQILSFNASIEAQRSGPAGAGFRVIAEEIRKLSEDTTQMAGKIDRVVRVVLSAINNMSDKSEEILKFMNENVVSDYQNFDKILLQNVKNAEEIAGIMNHFTKHAANLEDEIAESTNGIENISKNIQGNSEELQVISQNIQNLVLQMHVMKEETISTGKSAVRLKSEITAYVQQ